MWKLFPGEGWNVHLGPDFVAPRRICDPKTRPDQNDVIVAPFAASSATGLHITPRSRCFLDPPLLIGLRAVMVKIDPWSA